MCGCLLGMCPDWELNWRLFGSQPALNPLSYTSQGHPIIFYFFLLATLICKAGQDMEIAGFSSTAV